MIHCLYIFDRRGACLYYYEWQRPYNPLADDPAEDQRLMFGLCFSLRQFVTKMSPRAPVDGLHGFTTDTCTVHHFEAASGLRIVLCTDRQTTNLRDELRHIYTNVFVEYVTRNGAYKANSGEPIRCQLFEQELRRYVEGLTCFV